MQCGEDKALDRGSERYRDRERERARDIVRVLRERECVRVLKRLVGAIYKHNIPFSWTILYSCLSYFVFGFSFCFVVFLFLIFFSKITKDKETSKRG